MKKALLVLIILFHGFEANNKNVEPTVIPSYMFFNPNQSIDFRIKDELLRSGVKDTLAINFFIAQAKHETGDFKSKLFREHNNLFGMMFTSRRKTTALHGKARAEGRSGYASYSSIEASVQDFILFIQSRKYPLNYSSLNEYCITLKKKGYYTDTVERYRNGLKSKLNKTHVW